MGKTSRVQNLKKPLFKSIFKVHAHVCHRLSLRLLLHLLLLLLLLHLLLFFLPHNLQLIAFITYFGARSLWVVRLEWVYQHPVMSVPLALVREKTMVRGRGGGGGANHEVQVH